MHGLGKGDFRRQHGHCSPLSIASLLLLLLTRYYFSTMKCLNPENRELWLLKPGNIFATLMSCPLTTFLGHPPPV